MSAPYYQHGRISIYHGDALEILPTLQKECAQLIVTDPPYGVKWQSNYRLVKFPTIANDGSREVAEAALALAVDLLPNKRHLYAFGRYDLSGMRLTDPVELIWDKTTMSGGNLDLPWGSAHEYIQFCVKVISDVGRGKGEGKGAARLRRGSVLRHPKPNACAVRDHPTEKPVPLLRELIECSSRFGDVVLDPFVGSGSTAVAALLEGRGCIGIEIEERYCEVAARRLDALRVNEGLFAEASR